MDERDRARVYDEVVDFFNDVYFNGPVEKQNRLVSSQNEREPVYFYSNDFRSRDIFGNTLLNRYMLSFKLGNRHLIVGAGGLQSGVGPEEIAPTTHIPSTQFTHNRMLALPVVTVNYAFGNY